MKISFLNHKYGEREPVSLDLEDEVGDVVISGFRGDKKLVITVSDAPVEENDSQAGILAKVCLQRGNENSRELVLFYRIGITGEEKVLLHYNPNIDVKSIPRTARFVTVVSADSDGTWQPKNVLAIAGMPPE